MIIISSTDLCSEQAKQQHQQTENKEKSGTLLEWITNMKHAHFGQHCDLCLVMTELTRSHLVETLPVS